VGKCGIDGSGGGDVFRLCCVSFVGPVSVGGKWIPKDLRRSFGNKEVPTNNASISYIRASGRNRKVPTHKNGTFLPSVGTFWF